MNYPKISVITPSYNQGQFLEETIISVIGQGYPNLEYIVMDGGSSDNSKEILQKYNDQITFWVSEKDTGQSNAINKGFRMATGEILCWLNSDDMFMPNALFYMSMIADVSKRSVYFGNCIHFKNSNGNLTTYGSNAIASATNHLLRHLDYIIQPSSFWTRAAWLSTGPLKEEFHFAFDWEWFLRAEQNGVDFVPLQECLSMYRIHAEHKTGSGGEARQKEIISISHIFAPQRVPLLQHLQNESWNFKGIHFKFLRVLMRILRVPYSDNRLLKLYRWNKYRSFQPTDMDESRSMLFLQ
ncbi:glycosyltransferase family 2 protein [Flavitalea sp.]|nr:glycosyltransferase family 2 protein [Flavitalea sp.]